MKKIACFLLVIVLLGICTMAAASTKTDTPAPAARSAELQTAPEETASKPTEPTEPETTEETTEPLPTGLAAVELLVDAPETVSADDPAAVVTVSFSGVRFDSDRKKDCICTAQLLRNGEPVCGPEAFALTENTVLTFPLEYEFYRYMEQTEDVLTLRIAYEEETLERELRIGLENWPDEVYAEQSGDPRPYSIDVLRNENVVVVYGKDDAGEYTQVVKVFLCSTGRATPSGRYRLGWKTPWRALFGYVYGQYAIHVTGNILFHSVPYKHMSKDSLKSGEFNKLGTAASMGCIRMMVADEKWIYDHCPTYTPVHIYDVTELPVEKPEPILIDLEDPRAGWDPTDPDPENPWLSN